MNENFKAEEASAAAARAKLNSQRDQDRKTMIEGASRNSEAWLYTADGLWIGLTREEALGGPAVLLPGDDEEDEAKWRERLGWRHATTVNDRDGTMATSIASIDVHWNQIDIDRGLLVDFTIGSMPKLVLCPNLPAYLALMRHIAPVLAVAQVEFMRPPEKPIVPPKSLKMPEPPKKP